MDEFALMAAPTSLLGRQVGPYLVQASLGAGGMGEVYRARDAKLGRDVAIKILLPSFTRDPERLVRFEREARVLASINHSNIGAIYGLERVDDAPALVLELVEGVTLAEHLARRPRAAAGLPLVEALTLARQIADALDAAHALNIVHRDLKPANIKITPAGVVKVLDFGLAKAAVGTAIALDPGSSVTLTVDATRAGTVVGTAAYMSPEQARGQAVDKRTDIWAFGAVLFEMLTGRKVFGDQSTISDTIAGILTREPDWSALPADTPNAVARLLRRCLEKDVRRRLHDIGDARLDIDEALAAPSGHTPVQGASAAATSPSTAPAHSRATLVMLASAAGALAIVATIGWWMAWHSTRPVDRPLIRLSVDLGTDAVAGTLLTAAVSPDGTRLVFLVRGSDGRNRLATRLLDQSQSTVLAGTENASAPFFKPDGQWIGFFAGRKLKKVSVRGGVVVTLCDAPEGRGGSWGEDDNIIATLDANTGTGLSRIPAAGGKPVTLTKPAEHGEATHRWPQFLPGGETVLFMGSKTASNYDDSSIEVLSLKTGQVKVVQPGGYFGRYLPSGDLVYVHQGALLGVPFDLNRLAVRGTPVPLLDDVAGGAQNGSGQFDFSRDGLFVYLSGKAASGTWTVEWLDRNSKRQPLLGTPGIYDHPAIAPDGKRLAFSVNTDIVIYDIERDTKRQLTFTGQTNTNNSPLWAPDGNHIVWGSEDNNGFSIMWTRADGTGEPRTLLQSHNRLGPTSFSTDGKQLAFRENSPDTVTDISTLSLDLSDPDHPKPGHAQPFLHTPFAEQDARFSPDGRWIAYSAYTSTSGSLQVFVQPFPAQGSLGAGRLLISPESGSQPIWSRDGRALFYRAPDNRVMVVTYMTRGTSFEYSKPLAWSETRIWGDLYDLAPDRERFLVQGSPGEDTADSKASAHVTFLLNFFDEVRRRLPVK